MNYLIDPRNVASCENTETVIAPCEKYTDERLTIGGRTDWCQDNLYLSVWKNPDSEMYEGTYSKTFLDIKGNLGQSHMMRSRDGIHWETCSDPLMWPAAYMRDDHDSDPFRRYKALFTAFTFRKGTGNESASLSELGLFSASSPDCLDWNRFSPVMLHHHEHGHSQWRKHSSPYWVGGDNNPCLFYAEDQQKYVALYRTSIERIVDGKQKRRNRAIGRSESEDFLSWTPHELVYSEDIERNVAIGSERHDIHGIQVFNTGGLYFGIMEPYYWTRDDRMHLELSWSADTRHWERICPETDFIPHPDVGEPDGGCRFPACGIIDEGDHVRVYYGSCSEKFLSYHKGETDHERQSAMFMATFRKDQYAGLRACRKAVGTIITTPFRYEKGIQLNADASGGSLLAGILDEHGDEVPGVGVHAAVPITDNVLGKVLRWQDAQTADHLTGKTVALKIVLDNATVYGFEAG